MQQWEYLGVRLIPEAEYGRVTVLDPMTLKGTPLNELGRQGWEVVGVFRDNFWVLLKRPIEAGGAQTTTTATTSAEKPGAATQQGNLLPNFGLADEARERELERKLQQELEKRQRGGRR